MENANLRVVLVVPKHHVKAVKTALEQAGQLDKSAKIVPETSSQQTESEYSAGEQGMCINTTIPYPVNEDGSQGGFTKQDIKTSVVETLGLTSLHEAISISHSTSSISSFTKNPLHAALHAALQDLPQHILPGLNLTTKALVDSFPSTYTIYPPLLLLPHTTLSSPPWLTFLHTYPHQHPHSQSLWARLALATATSHVAINSPILLQTPPNDNGSGTSNILRSPTNIQPLYGLFGPPPKPAIPTQQDFNTALWVHATQNSIHQTWAPLHTMFSRGNMREKTRILRLPDISSNQTVVDMYAGIGYFAFSYKRAGAGKVVCFELNGWSVEGMRRGCERNGWGCKIFREEGLKSLEAERKKGLDLDGVDFLIFQMSNAHAVRVLTQLHKLTPLPPVRHVNLGLLPDARAAWRDAARLMDVDDEGGCVRVHENVGTGEIEERAREVEAAFQGYLDEEEEDDGRRRRSARVAHVERVKMYAPGVVHCVFDVRIS